MNLLERKFLQTVLNLNSFQSKGVIQMIKILSMATVHLKTKRNEERTQEFDRHDIK